MDAPSPPSTPATPTAPKRNPLFDALHKGTLFMRPLGEPNDAWGYPWKLIPPDWVAGPVGALLVKDIDLPPAAPGRITGFSLATRDQSSSARQFVAIDPITVLGHSGVRLSRVVCVPEFLFEIAAAKKV